MLSHLRSPTLQTRILISQDLGQGIHFFSFLTEIFLPDRPPFFNLKAEISLFSVSERKNIIDKWGRVIYNDINHG